jgi:hypothetical protein
MILYINYYNYYPEFKLHGIEQPIAKNNTDRMAGYVKQLLFLLASDRKS